MHGFFERHDSSPSIIDLSIDAKVAMNVLDASDGSPVTELFTVLFTMLVIVLFTVFWPTFGLRLREPMGLVQAGTLSCWARPGCRAKARKTGA
jgi:hypothetical protein